VNGNQSYIAQSRKFWFRLEPRFNFDPSKIAPLRIRLLKSGEVRRNSRTCKWTLWIISGFAVLLIRCICRTESFNAWNNHGQKPTFPLALILAMFGCKQSPATRRYTLFPMQDEDTERLALRLVPCSCGTTFSVAEDYDRQGTHLRSFLVCPNCGKRHDPKNRLLRIGYERAGYWKVDDC
jgi:hypothetical protein